MPKHYHFRVGGHIDPSWSAWFDGLTVTHDSDGCTTLAGPVVDQAALYGMLTKIRDLGLVLLSVTRVDQEGVEGRRCDGRHDTQKGNGR